MKQFNLFRFRLSKISIICRRAYRLSRLRPLHQSRIMPRRSFLIVSLLGFMFGLLIASWFQTSRCLCKDSEDVFIDLVLRRVDLNETFTISKPLALKRLRYVADELGIRKKLFLGIVLTDYASHMVDWYASLDTDPISWALAFFANERDEWMRATDSEVLNRTDTVLFSDTRRSLSAFYVLKYLHEHAIGEFDWVLILDGSCYLDVDRLLDTLAQLSVSSEKCSVTASVARNINGAGMIIATRLIETILSGLTHCLTNVDQEDKPLIVLSQCIDMLTTSKCGYDLLQHSHFLSWKLPISLYGSQMDVVDKDKFKPGFNQSLIVYPVNSLAVAQALDRMFTASRIKKLERYLQGIRNDDKCFTTSAFKPDLRHDVLAWDYFTTTHLFTGADVVSPFSGHQHKDLQSALLTSIDYITKQHVDETLIYNRMINGYDQLDTTYGSRKILDLSFFPQPDRLHRVELRRAFLNPIISAEYGWVTKKSSTTEVFVIVDDDDDDDDADDDLNDVDRALRLVSKVTAMKHKVKVIVRGKNEESANILKHLMGVKHKDLTVIATTNTILNLVRDHPIFKFGHGDSEADSVSLVFISAMIDETHLASFLEKANLNVISGEQFYCPIPFVSYHPRLINITQKKSFAQLPSASTIQLHKNTGWFNRYNFDYIAIALSDLLDVQRVITEADIAANRSLCEVAVSRKGLGMLRSPDPTLRQYYQPVKWLNHTCLKQKAMSIGSLNQLAALADL